MEEATAAVVKPNEDKTSDSPKDMAADDFFYPNPAGDNLYFNNTGSTPARVSIYDMHGRMVFTKPVTEHSVDISSLAKGVYLIKLEHEGKTLIDKLMKE